MERRLSTSIPPLLHSQHPRLPTSWGHLGCLHGPKDFKIVPKSCPRNLPGHPNAPTDCAKTSKRRPSVSPRIWATGRSGDWSRDWSHNLVLVCRLRAIGWHFGATGACTVSSTSRSLLHAVHALRTFAAQLVAFVFPQTGCCHMLWANPAHRRQAFYES